MKDLIDELYATRRAVGVATLPAGAAHVVTLSREYPADIDDVWSALTTAERIARWFLPVSGDLRPRGTYQLEGNAGGEIRVCEPPHRLQLTWIMGEPPSDEDSSIVEVRLSATSSGTRLELEHAAVVPPEMWSQFGPGAVGVGWDGGLLGLARHLAGLEVGDHEQLESDPELRAFMTASSEEWGKALRASGADPETVEQAVAATTSFYVPARG
jgi:uncharacterized protein YndB with AHSA1/START domain